MYTNTNDSLYEDIALWEKTEGISLFRDMPLEGNSNPRVLDFGHRFGEYLFAASSAFPEGEIVGVDRSPVCNKEVSQKISD